MFGNIYKNRRVIVTGHTGFKGSWLSLWLRELGAEVCGIALKPDTEVSHSELLNIDMRSEICDIRDLDKVSAIFNSFKPEIVFHLAAQPLVIRSYADPVTTFQTNVLGTVNILEVCRELPSVKAVVAISSDKCYENRETPTGYKEDDPMGGYDPYSASKGCTELVISSYRRSFFNPDDYEKKHSLLLASARAGNVIGGGDWAEHRLVPDIMRAAHNGVPAMIRNPHSIRPWQHVLEPLSGYLTLGEKLFCGRKEFASAWNFGPDSDSIITVKDAAESLRACWQAIEIDINPPENQLHEAATLLLDCTKARRELHWHGALAPQETFDMTAQWYKAFYSSGRIISRDQLETYISTAKLRSLEWTK